MEEEVDDERGPSGALAVMKGHPVITAVMIACTLIGAGMGFAMLPEDWLLLRRIAGGALAGAGTGLMLTATKMIG